MFNAQYIFQSDELYSPWMNRQGDSIRATLDLIQSNGGTLEVRVYTKSVEDAGDGLDADATTSISSSTVGRADDEWNAVLKDLVRYRFKCTGAASGDYVLFRMLTPVWFNAIDASV